MWAFDTESNFGVRTCVDTCGDCVRRKHVGGGHDGARRSRLSPLKATWTPALLAFQCLILPSFALSIQQQFGDRNYEIDTQSGFGPVSYCVF